jgi:hypothetical protein
MIRYMITMMAASAGSALGWWLGNFVGFMTAYFLAVFGASIGWYFGRRLVRNLTGE